MLIIWGLPLILKKPFLFIPMQVEKATPLFYRSKPLS
ncbi:hypothetical protein BAZSYMB_GCONTIG00858_0 [Bathymodiolus azoricus thioautotrophic gill symbiont]|uniref:Uncharacterized protein n=1 Tax=Bathymodiolus azoricus thioautotrophic gill symbiont TaxID=235205 RepID=A0A1H6K0Y8_9GAMM|nr:hypothetical protein BAZSYMB_GCONTIG00858_0 [Bathymodiolus azoricus thioautotrophic gill symbiont]